MLSSYTQINEVSGVKFYARAIRRDKGQIRADVSIQVPDGDDWRELDRDEFRFSDRQKRNALANSAFEALKDSLPMPGKKQEMQALLRMFNDTVEEQFTQSIIIEDVPGLAEPHNPPWVVQDYVTEGAGTLLVGPPGVGKSWTGLLLAQSVQYAIPALYGVSAPRPVLYVNLERSRLSLQNRLGLVNRTLGLDPTATMPQLNARGRSVNEVAEAVRRHIEKHETELVVWDSLSRMGMGSMSDDDVANQMMDALNSYPTAWCALGHTPRPQGAGKAAVKQSEHVFGSQMLTAAADFEIILKAKESVGQTLVGFKVIKANDAPKVSLKAWLYEFGSAGLAQANPAAYVDEQSFEEDE